MFDVERTMDVVRRSGVKLEGVLFMRLLYLEEHHKGALPKRPFVYVYEYGKYANGWALSILEKCKEKGYIENINPNVTEMQIDNLKLTPKFYEELAEYYKEETLITTEDSNKIKFELFFSAYPAFIDNFNNPKLPKIPVKAVNKKELEKEFKTIITNAEDFALLLQATESAVKDKRINMNITKWLTSEIWREYKSSDTNQDTTYMQV